jgi:hypothetical protein
MTASALQLAEAMQGKGYVSLQAMQRKTGMTYKEVCLAMLCLVGENRIAISQHAYPATYRLKAEPQGVKE